MLKRQDGDIVANQEMNAAVMDLKKTTCKPKRKRDFGVSEFNGNSKKEKRRKKGG